jgi:hypothetical protein
MVWAVSTFGLHHDGPFSMFTYPGGGGAVVQVSLSDLFPLETPFALILQGAGVVHAFRFEDRNFLAKKQD